MQIDRAFEERALRARLLAAISFHFDSARLGPLAETLRSLAEFPVAGLEVVILTNAADEERLALLHRLAAETLGHQPRIDSHPGLADPWSLTWCHKAIIAGEFLAAGSRFTHFIYLEADIRLSFANFCYWLEYREGLRPDGLLPAFVRMEYRAAAPGFVTSDAFWPVYLPAQAYLRRGDRFLVNMPNPYNPFFLLDRELAREYVVSASFDEVRSQDVSLWATSERAAMGLCLENVPVPFSTRYVVPVEAESGKVPAHAWTWHIPNNYADNPQSPLGKVRMDSLFQGIAGAVEIGPWGVERHDAPPHLAGIKLAGAAAKRETGPESDDLYYLATDHDTVVYLDPEASRLRHAPLGLGRLNLLCEILDGRARLWAAPDGGSGLRRLSFAAELGEIRLEPERGEADHRVVPITDLIIGLRIGQFFLSADLDGLVRNNRQLCQRWEHYRLLRADSFAALPLMRRHSWLSHEDRRILCLADQPLYFARSGLWEASALAATLAPGAVEFRRNLVFGPARLPLVTRERMITLGDAGEGLAPSWIEIGTPQTTHRFSRFAPLVHYRLSGNDEVYEALQRSLTSLTRQGRYRGAVSIACDRPEAELRPYIPEELNARITIRRIPAENRAPDAGLEQAFSDRHQPVLLARPEAIFEVDILDLLIDGLLQGCRVITLDEAGPAPVAAGESRPDPALPGFLGQAELMQLALLAEGVPPRGCIVETGTASAGISRVLAGAARAGTTLYCLDDWDDAALASFRDSLAAFPHAIALPGQDPRDFLGWQREVDLLVENSRPPNSARHASLAFWRRLVRPGGVICGRSPGEDAGMAMAEALARACGASIQRQGNLWLFSLPPA